MSQVQNAEIVGLFQKIQPGILCHTILALHINPNVQYPSGFQGYHEKIRWKGEMYAK